LKLKAEGGKRGWEVNVPAPLSNDLRERLVAAYENGEGSFAELAARFHVGRSSVLRYVQRKRETGAVDPKPPNPGPEPKIDDAGLLVLTELVAEEPDRTNEEFAAAYTARTGVAVSDSAISRAFARINTTRKKSHKSPRSATPPKSPRSARTSKPARRR
jgi:transposase